jgi:acetyl-CoA carboxylase biotin carboxyl carrier protein
MNQKELRELIEFLKEQDIAEFELERGDVKVRIKRAMPSVAPSDTHYFAMHPAPPAAPESAVLPAVAAAGAPASAAKATTTPPSGETLHTVRSPIVGTFYESPSPGSPPFVKPGDAVELGQVLCIVEAMKLMNEIESDVTGELVEILVKNGQPIEYGQELFTIRPRG